MEVNGYLHAPNALSPGNNFLYPLNTEWVKKSDMTLWEPNPDPSIA
jgi:hypothetical protein